MGAEGRARRAAGITLLFLALAATLPPAARGAVDGDTGFLPSRLPAQRQAEALLLEQPTPARFRAHLERITRDPHPAGSAANMAVADYLEATMRAAGFEVERHEVEAWMPVDAGHVDVALVTPERLPLNTQENILPEDPSSSHPGLQPGRNAYAAPGDVTAQVVYVNYGRREDYTRLEKLGVSLAGRIVLARYGGNYRGFKVKYAEAAGAVGVLLFSDPANGGYPTGAVYPEGSSWPGSAVQRGSLKTLPWPGDPLTPGTAARPGHRPALDPDEVALPKIPVAPLPYDSAREILGRMEGQPVPRGWQGGLPFTYRVTGGPGLTVRLRVEQRLGPVRLRNVVGTLRGSERPDEWVIFGSHYDAWEFGAADPNGGTSALLSLAESLGELARQGMRPRRSIVIAHWDGEEQGIIGSTEYVEEFRKQLQARAVAYVNADMSVTGPHFGASASPSLKGPVIAAAAAVSRPDTALSVLAAWRSTADKEPAVGDLGGGSDHVGFYTYVGVPSAWASMSGVSLYHSGYDTFTFFERFCDPEFTYGPTLARVQGILALRLANADVLPYDVGRYAEDLGRHVTALGKTAEEAGVAFDTAPLRPALTRVAAAADSFVATRDRVLAAGGPRDGRRVSARLLELEKAFLREKGLQYSAWSRSLYATPDPFSGYATWILPGLRYEILEGTPEGVRAWTKVYIAAFDDLAQRIRAATEALAR